MNESRKNLIEDLAADLKPVARPGQIVRPASLWLAAAFVYTLTNLLVDAPLRPGAVANLAVYPFFALEIVVAFATIIAFTLATLRLAIPGRSTPNRAFVWPLTLLGAWLAFYLAGLWFPAHPVSDLGVRNHCVWETVLLSMPNLILLLVLVRRLYPVWPVATAAAAGAAAGAVPAALMQLACMYDPAHTLTHHLPPILLLGAIGAIAGRSALSKRVTVPRKRDASIH